MLEESKTKTGTIKTRSENVNTITNTYWIISENYKYLLDYIRKYKE